MADLRPAPLPPGAAPHEPAPVRTGVLAGAAGGRPLVDFEGNPHGPLPARTMVPLDAAALTDGAARRRGVVLLFDGGDPRRPIIAGFLEPVPETPALEAALATTLGPAPEATVDGDRRVIEAKEEVVLRCGEASITLRRDGRVVIRGAYVETHAAGTNRVKGATVKIN